MASGVQVLPLPGYKKRRLQGACDICKRKKIRCDSMEMPGGRCSNCIAFDSECTHATAKKRGRIHRKLSTTTHAQKISDISPPTEGPQRVTHSLVRSIISSSTYDVPNDIITIRQSLASLAQHAFSLEQELANLKKVTSGGNPDPNKQAALESFDTSIVSTSALADDDDIALSESLKNLIITPWHSRFFGTSSSAMLLKTAIEMQNASNGGQPSQSPGSSVHLRPVFWNSYPWQQMPLEPCPPQLFPDHDLLRHLIQLYFDNINIHFPLLHRPTFERSIRDNLHLTDRAFGASVLALCAVASRYSNDPRVILEGTDSLHSSGWKWFRQIKHPQRSLSQVPLVYELHTYCLSVMFLQGSSTPEASWIYIGNGIRVAQDVGAHRRKPTRKPSVEDELWKRAFWVLTCFDTILCYILGRPRATNSKEYDLDLPVDCDDEYWEVAGTEVTFKQPPGKPSRVASFITFLKLMEILDAAQRTIYSVNKSARLLDKPLDNHQVVTELDSELNKWIDSVPDHLQWDPQRRDHVFFEQSAMLYTSYYNIQTLIHRPFIPSPSKRSPLPFPSLAICTNAARSCIHLMALESRRGFMPLPHTVMALFTSAVVLLLNVWAGKLSGFSGDPRKDIQGVVSCLDIMHTYESRWLTAGRLCDTICELSSAGGIQLPSTTENPGAGPYMEVSSDTQGVTDSFTAGEQDQSSLELRKLSQELSDLLKWPLYSTDLGQSPDYHPFDGSLVGDDHWYQSSLYSGFTDPPKQGGSLTNPLPGNLASPFH